jgi:hypothetical protein
MISCLITSLPLNCVALVLVCRIACPIGDLLAHRVGHATSGPVPILLLAYGWHASSNIPVLFK